MDSLGEEFEKVGDYLFGGKVDGIIATSLMTVVALEMVEDSPLHLRVIAQTSQDPVWSTSFEVSRGEVEIGDLVRFDITKGDFVVTREREVGERPFRVIGSDDVEVPGGHFPTRESAEDLKRGMNQLGENWLPANNRCRPPYRVQEHIWKDV